MDPIQLPCKPISGFWATTLGMLGKDQTHEAICFLTNLGIHTFGMRHPIDVVLVNQARSVVGIKSSLMPFRLFFWGNKRCQVCELPEGTIDRLGITLGKKVACSRTYQGTV